MLPNEGFGCGATPFLYLLFMAPVFIRQPGEGSSVTSLSSPAQEADKISVCVHAPGGVMAPEDWSIVSEVARRYGDGDVHLVGHSCLEIHGIASGSEEDVEARFRQTELIREHLVLAAPLFEPARSLAHRLSLRLESTGQGLVAPDVVFGVLPANPEFSRGMDTDAVDVAVVLDCSGPQPTARVLVDDRETGTAVDDESALDLAVEAAMALEPAGRALTTTIGADRPIGWIAEHHRPGTVTLGAGVHRGILAAEHAELLGVVGLPTSVTPHGDVLIHDLPEADADVILRVLAPRGFIFDANSDLL